MPKVKNLIADKGMTFKNMFVTSPLCCPSRSSILTGQYLHNHNALNNSLNGNCSSPIWQKVSETKAFPVYLKNKGYSTFFAGKYLNQYGSKGAGGVEHKPPGWDDWHGLVGNSKYYNYSLSVNGKEEKHGDDYKNDYLTDLIARRALNFLSKRHSWSGSPFFMMLSTPSCHQPNTPAPQYKGNFSSSKAPRTKHFNVHAKDKHWLLNQAKTPMANDTIKFIDELFRNRWRTLLSVDDMVESVVTKLQEMGELENTYIFFSSDNGYHLGQFSLPYDKRQMYDFDIRVPLMVRGPKIKAKTTSQESVMSIDLAPTFLDLAGIAPPPQFDGQSFQPLLLNEAHEFRAIVLVEYYGEHQDSVPGCPHYKGQNMANCDQHCVCEDTKNNTYGCIRYQTQKEHYKYCAFQDKQNFVEVYDMKKDPLELNNIALSASPQLLTFLSQELANLSLCSGATCRKKSPFPPTFSNI